MSGQRGNRQPWSTKRKVLVGAAVVVCAPAFIAGAINGARQSSASPAAKTVAAASDSAPAATSSAARPSTATKPAAEPTFTFPGDRQCAITYRDRGDGTMSWTATTSVAGELRTHAGTGSGSLYQHDQQVPVGPSAFTAPVPLAQVDDIGGTLTTSGGGSYACSVAPAH